MTPGRHAMSVQDTARLGETGVTWGGDTVGSPEGGQAAPGQEAPRVDGGWTDERVGGPTMHSGQEGAAGDPAPPAGALLA